MSLETDYGVPSVGVHADVFSRLVDSVVRVNGMPRARRAFVPTPVLGVSTDTLRAYVGGEDPTSGRPFAEVLVEALTRPLADEDLRGVSFDRSTPRFVEPDTEENLQLLFRQQGWTDFLPIVLPTEERVAAMLAATSRGRDEIVGTMRPTAYRELWEYTVEKVAVNAVMAGADPAYFPVILALASTGITARNSTTSSAAAMVVVNGPIRNEIMMNSGLGALGPYNHANATIGRAYSLLSQNLQGGSVPGETYMGSQGNNLNYNSVTFAENEEASPWDPYHVQQGFDRDESTVTTFYVWGNNWTEGLRSTWQEKMKAMLGGQDPFLGTILVLDPIVAREFHQLGFTTKDKLTDWIFENVRIPASQYWDSYTAKTFTREAAELGIEPFATYAEAPPDELLPVFQPHQINIVVVGGSSNGQWSSFNGEPLDQRFRRPEDRHIVSVDEWR
ncbi:MAG TPA: UGSC family (seleno)protein [Acidimicrobiia bacterium]|jgi:hypothetical protein